jgi:hypothetical protein
MAAGQPLWYISFADAEKFRGVTVVEASSAEEAFFVACERGLNPGGEAMILPVPPPYPDDALRYLNRLVDQDELVRDGATKRKDLDPQTLELVDSHATRVCADCN